MSQMLVLVTRNCLKDQHEHQEVENVAADEAVAEDVVEVDEANEGNIFSLLTMDALEILTRFRLNCFSKFPTSHEFLPPDIIKTPVLAVQQAFKICIGC